MVNNLLLKLKCSVLESWNQRLDLSRIVLILESKDSFGDQKKKNQKPS